MLPLDTSPAFTAQVISRLAGAGAMCAAVDRVRGWPRRRDEPALRYPSQLILSVLDDIAAIADQAERLATLPAARRRVFELLHGRAAGPSAIFRPRWTTTKNQ